MLSRAVTDLESARLCMAELTARARQQGRSLRAPSPEPIACCGRGCNGCVWEGYFAAVEYWREEALDKLRAAQQAFAPRPHLSRLSTCASASSSQYPGVDACR